MAVKSIIDIELNDARFNNYQKLFADYEKRLAGHPKIWAQINSQIKGGVTGFNELVALETAAIGKQKLIAEAQAKAIRLTKTEAEYWRDMAHSTKTVASNIASATTSLLKWGTLTSVFTGLLGAGGLFGIERLGQAAASGRQRGFAINTTFGEQQAFSTNFERAVVDPGMLDNVNAALHSASGRASLYGAGVRDLSGNTTDVALRVLQGLKTIADSTPDALLTDTLQARGLDKIISSSEFQKIKATSREEWDALYAGFARDRNAMGVGAGDLRKWQDFITTLDEASNTIESVFIRGLAPLTPGLAKLSDAVTHVVERFLGSKSIGELVDKAGAGLEKFADYVGTPEFQKDIEVFVNGVGFMAKKIGGFVSWLGGGEGSEGYEETKARAGALRSARASGKATVGSQFIDIFRNASSAADQDKLLAMVRGLERSGDNAISPAGAVGRYQIEPGTAKQYGFDPSRLTDPAYNETVARAVLADLSKRYGGNTDEILAAYNAGPGRANKYRSSGHDPGSIPEETRKYIEHAHKMSGYTPTVNVKIENEAGGTIISNTRQVAQ